MSLFNVYNLSSLMDLKSFAPAGELFPAFVYNRNEDRLMGLKSLVATWELFPAIRYKRHLYQSPGLRNMAYSHTVRVARNLPVA